MESIDQSLIRAIKQGDIKRVQALVQDAPDLLQRPIKTNWLEPALTYAIKQHQTEIVCWMLDNGAKVHWFEFGNREQPLLHAMLESNMIVFDRLIEAGAVFDMPDPFYQNLIWRAIIRRQDEPFAQRILAIAPEFLDMPDSVGNNVVEIAASVPGMSCRFLSFLVEQGGEFRSALGEAVEVKNTKAITCLIRLGADLNVRCPWHASQGSTLLHLATDWPDIPDSLLDTLFAAGIDLNTIGRNGVTALAEAVWSENDRFLKRALSAGADPNQGDEESTCLHLAVESKARDAILLLLDAGADINALNSDGETSLDLCHKESGYKRIAKLLEDRGGKVAAQLGRGDDALLLPLDCNQPWADAAYNELSELPGDRRTLWIELITHCRQAEGSKPTKTWLKKTIPIVDAIGPEPFKITLRNWLNRLLEENLCDLSEVNTFVVRGLIWCSKRFDDPELVRQFALLAERGFHKVPYYGPCNAKLANGAMLSLVEMPGETGLMALAIFRQKTKYGKAIASINRVLEAAAKARGITLEQLLEEAIPDLGLNEVGYYEEVLGDFVAQLALVATGKSKLTWRTPTGKKQKTVPAALKSSHPEEIKHIKALAKDLEQASMAERRRLERFYLEPKRWPVDEWRDKLIEHPVTGFVARRLIWRFSNPAGEAKAGIWLHAGGVDSKCQPFDLRRYKQVELWHPIWADIVEIQAWQTLLQQQQIAQPFKQAHREIYRLTDAERKTRDHSLRFSGHLLRQHQVHALAEDRGWRQTLGGHWDGGRETEADRDLPSIQLRVQFEMTPDEETGLSGNAIFLCVGTGKVRFFQSGDVPGQEVRLETVPELEFSEVMRDIDLFVAVAGVGNDPNWEDRQQNRYWQEYQTREFSKQAETRKTVLEGLMPKLKIASQLRIDGRYLHVQGKLRGYKIHIGSGSILMEPDNSYLCIVEGKKSNQEVFLPFEGDNQLSQILAKAFMLAADDKIKDPTIRSQIQQPITSVT